MKVILAAQMGLCFGVRDAIETAHRVANPTQVAVHGELVHNQQVLAELSARGIAIHPESNRAVLPSRPHVLVTAHGISHKERQRLLAAGKTLIDTTCPLVRRVHDAAQSLKAAGYFVIVIGKPDHVEVQGIVGDLEHFTVVQAPDEVNRYDASRLGVVCQSTTAPSQAAEVRAAIEHKNHGKEIRFIDTICRPTRERQEAVRDLLKQVEALVVVGGQQSNNTRQLGLLAERQGVPWFHVETAADLDSRWFAPYEVVGLTAGTSTPDPIIQAVHRALLAMPAAVREPALVFG